MKKKMRAGIKGLEIPLLTSDESASPTGNANCPGDFECEKIRKQVKKDFGLDLAGGQQHLKGKIVRIGHMGYCTAADVLQIISILEIGLQKIGKQIILGQGVSAAQEVYLAGGMKE